MAKILRVSEEQKYTLSYTGEQLNKAVGIILNSSVNEADGTITITWAKPNPDYDGSNEEFIIEQSTVVNKTKIDELVGRVGSCESNIGSKANQSDLSSLSGEVQGINNRLTQLESNNLFYLEIDEDGGEE